MFNESIQYILPNFHTKQHNHHWPEVLLVTGLIIKLVKYKGGTGLLSQLIYKSKLNV